MVHSFYANIKMLVGKKKGQERMSCTKKIKSRAALSTRAIGSAALL
jgi:hypothetical protein